MNNTILIFGITGQDGSYLTEYLLDIGYTVHGVIRRSSSFNTGKIEHLMNDKKIYNKRLFLHYGDITDSLSVNNIISTVKPDKIFNLAAQSHVKTSFEIPLYTANVDALGPLHVMEAVKNYSPKTKVYNAATSELFGGIPESMPKNGYNESSSFHPRSPYSVSKLYGYWTTKNYREAYDLFAVNGILFNHESPRRTPTFITRKITKWIGENINNIKNNQSFEPLEIGNLDAMRDWGHAKDFVKAMDLILNQEKPEDYVVSTGETHSVRFLIEKCFDFYNLTIQWQGSGLKEKGVVDGKIVVQINPKYFRPSEVDILLGDSTKIRNLGWRPEYNFNQLIEEMLWYDTPSIR